MPAKDEQMEAEADFSQGIHDTLEKALAGELGDGDDIQDTPAEAHEAPDEAPAPDQAAADTETKAGGDEVPAKEAAEAPQPDSQAEKPDAQAAEAPGARIAPEHWPAAEREAFDGLDDTAKDFALAQGKRLEGLHQTKSEELSTRFNGLEQYREIDTAMQAQQAQLVQAGLTPATYIGRLMAYDQALRANPQGALAQLAKDFGVDLGSTQTQPTEADQEYQDPAISATNSRIDQLEASNRAIAQSQAQAAQASNVAQVAQFRDAKDAAGNLSHPHFAAVEAEMTAEARRMGATGEAFTLDTLYDRAIWNTQAVREQVLTADKAKAATEQAAAQKAQAVKGKAATTTLATSSGGAGESQGEPVPMMNEIAARLAGTFDG